MTVDKKAFETIEKLFSIYKCPLCEKNRIQKERKKQMEHKNETEKIIIHTSADLKPFEEKDLQGKHLVMKRAIRDVKLGTLEGCIIEGGGIVCNQLMNCKLYDVTYVYAESCKLSVFKGCEKIQLGTTDSDNQVSESQFYHCSSISLEDTEAEECIFNNFGHLYLASVAMDNCIIADIICENDCAIGMEDSEIKNVSFENITLQNGAYLIEGYGTPWVEESTFLNIRTDRDDKEIFHQEETTGKIFKKKKEYSFVDEESCTGLMQIMGMGDGK